MRRRNFLKAGIGGTAAALSTNGWLPWLSDARADPLPGHFPYGVASGDPLPNAVVIWTRLTPSPEATPGSNLGAATAVVWEVAEDREFTRIVRSGSVVTDPATDHTVHLDVDGLAPATTYCYRFRALGDVSVVGQTRTTPAAGDAPPSLRIGVVSCSNWEGGWFSAYRHLAARDDLDFVLHLGDYVYENGAGSYGAGEGIGRVHDPDVEITTLEHYRRRHALHKTDADLRALHQRYPWVTTWDDHEVTNDRWSAGAENHDAGEGDYLQRQAWGYQAYFEWMPVRRTGGSEEPHRLHRRLRFGTLADLFVLDVRTYRSQPLEGAAGGLLVSDAALDDDTRTMLGADQLAWFEGGLDASQATWRLIGNPVMFAPFILPGDLPDAVQDLLADLFDEFALPASVPIAVNGDQWDGYRAEQRRLAAAFGEAGGVVVLTGDIHSSWAVEVPADPATYLPAVGGPTVAVEFVGPAVTSDALEAELSDRGIPSALSLLADEVVTTGDPWVKYLDPNRHGFGVFDVSAERAQFDFFYVSDREDPAATLVTGPAWMSPLGTNRLQPAAGALPARPIPDPREPLLAAVGPAAPSAPVAPILPATGGGGALVAGAAAVAAALAARRVAVARQEGRS